MKDKELVKILDGFKMLHDENLQLMRLVLNAVLPEHVAKVTVEQIEELWNKNYEDWRKKW